MRTIRLFLLASTILCLIGCSHSGSSPSLTQITVPNRGLTSSSQCGGVVEGVLAAGHQTLETLSASDLWFDDSVSGEDRLQVKTGLTIALTYLASRFSPSHPVNACLDVRASSEGPVGIGRANPGFILLVTAPQGWPDQSDWALARVTAHEIVHVWQLAIAGQESFATSAVWLLEGMAGWVSSQSLIKAQLGSAEQLNPLLETHADPLTPHLSMLETPEGWSTSLLNYRVSFQALSFLMSTREPSQLMAYLVDLGRGESWPAAFLDAFGLSTDDFYRLFDAKLQMPIGPAQGSDSAWRSFLLQEEGWRRPLRDLELLRH